MKLKEITNLQKVEDQFDQYHEETKINLNKIQIYVGPNKTHQQNWLTIRQFFVAYFKNWQDSKPSIALSLCPHLQKVRCDQYIWPRLPMECLKFYSLHCIIDGRLNFFARFLNRQDVSGIILKEAKFVEFNIKEQPFNEKDIEEYREKCDLYNVELANEDYDVC